jgi:hypothetical protein
LEKLQLKQEFARRSTVLADKAAESINLWSLLEQGQHEMRIQKRKTRFERQIAPIK